MPIFRCRAWLKATTRVGAGRRYLGIFVAGAAGGFDGKEIVRSPGAFGGRGVAGGALQFEIQVEFMREGRGIGRAPRKHQDGESLHPL